MNTINRLQLRHHTPIFETREAAIEYIYSQIRFADEGLAFEDKRYGFSLLGEPTVLLYKNVTEADPTGENDPHLIFAIGSATNEGTQYNDNRFCIIDIDKTEKEIEDLWEELEKAIKSLSIVTRDTNTLKLYSEKTESGTVISGDVVVAASHIFNDARKPNIILNTEDGLFTYVNMEVDEEAGHISFTVNGDTKEWTISDNYLVKGYYSKKDESLHLLRKDGEDVVISLENLIDEWGVEGEASNTPIVLTREEVGYGDDALHNHVEPWQDVLKADVRLADRKYNILKKTSDGRYLYVDGLANNITFFKDGQEISVQDALTNATKGVSNDSTNIIYEKADGYYATASLKYRNKENKLVFTTSNVTGGTTVEEIQLNAVEAFKKIIYDPVTETLIIMYVDGNGDLQEVQVPIGEMMRDWEWDIQNEGHNVKLHKQRVVGGNDKVSADAAIYDDPDNILVDKNHELFVKGTADNIKYGRDGNVSDELDKLNANDANINVRLNETSGKVDTLRAEFDAEVERATTEEQRIEAKLDSEISRSNEKDAEHDGKINTIEQTIGDGFTTDGHETVTYKFNELSAKTNSISAKTDTINANLGLLSAKTEAEIVRAKGEEQRIEKKFDDALGDGFNIRNTVRDEFDKEKSERIGEDARLQTEIDALSASTGGKLVDVINLDHSINVDKTDAVRPVIKVNLSNETIEGMQNVIKLNNDGLYAGVDLDYYFESGTSKNVLVFKTTNGTKTFDLKTNSVVDKIYYDPTKEAIIIEYTVDGKRMPDVVVPVHDLINEWRVSEDTNGAIKLYKTRESGATQDVLYAESIISDHEDNILVNDNGALYVSRKPITDLENRMDSVEERVGAAETDIDTLQNGLAEEIRRAKGEEQRIEQKLDQEITRSTNKDSEHDAAINTLRTDLTTETNARINADNELRDAIHAEEDRAKTAESAITQELVAEITDRINADNTLEQKILTETNNRISGDTILDAKINGEIALARSEEARIERKLDQEITRSTTKDDDLQGQISNEVSVRAGKDNDLQIAITNETARAKGREDQIEANLNLEIQRAEGAEANLQTSITSEKQAREDEDARIWRVIRPIEFYDTTTIHNERVRNSGADPDEVRHSVIVANAPENIIKVSEIKGGLYATVSIGYNESANALTIYDGIGQDRKIINTVTLGPGSVIKDITYDYAEKSLILTYRRAGEDHDTTTKFPVADLFNEWDVQNPSEGSAIELNKISQSGETGNVDKIWGRVLLTSAVSRPDGTIDYGDNIIRIVNNGLYASGSAMTEALEIVKCVKNETRSVEVAVLGEDVGDRFPCGSGFTYIPYTEGCFISAATSMYDADRLLDKYVCSAHSRITEVGEELDCLRSEMDVVENNVIGLVVGDCGLNPDGTLYVYPKDNNACFISAATSMYNADQILDTELCRLRNEFDCISGEAKMTENVLGIVGNCDNTISYPTTTGCLLSTATTFANADAILETAVCKLLAETLEGSERPTASVNVEEDPANENNKLIKVDVRLSHGKAQSMSDSDLTISADTSDIGEYSDTNALRIVDIAGSLPNTAANGLFLSNVWDCKEYTEGGVGTPGNKYRTDNSATSMNLFANKYRNGVRYNA